jgi:cell division transport system permease protein
VNREVVPSSLLRRPAARGNARPVAAGDGAAQSPVRAVPPRKLGLFGRVRSYVEHHMQAMFNTLGRMARTPLSTLMTVAVIGIALALPTGLYLVLNSAKAVSASWEDAAQISLYLRHGIDDEQARRLAREIGAMEQVALVSYVSPEAALDEFQRLSGFGEALDVLQENPLPAVLLVRPRLEFTAPAAVESLLARLRAQPGVDSAQLDLEWVKRLYAIMQIAQRAVLVLGVLLALAVLLIIGNTIRLSIQSRREEIVVQKLIGATNGFVRRPFLYNGLFHGLFGAVFAWLLVSLALWLLAGPVRRLSALYDSGFHIGGIGLLPSLVLLGGGLLLGLFGAWLAVGRQIRAIEPS